MGINKDDRLKELIREAGEFMNEYNAAKSDYWDLMKRIKEAKKELGKLEGEINNSKDNEWDEERFLEERDINIIINMYKNGKKNIEIADKIDKTIEYVEYNILYKDGLSKEEILEESIRS